MFFHSCALIFCFKLFSLVLHVQSAGTRASHDNTSSLL